MGARRGKPGRLGLRPSDVEQGGASEASGGRRPTTIDRWPSGSAGSAGPLRKGRAERPETQSLVDQGLLELLSALLLFSLEAITKTSPGLPDASGAYGDVSGTVLGLHQEHWDQVVFDKTPWAVAWWVGSGPVTRRSWAASRISATCRSCGSPRWSARSGVPWGVERMAAR
jgi:hypothetical protein